MPINYSKYPSNWKTEIRPRILKRANDCCEFCGVKNYAIGFRDQLGKFHELENNHQNDTWAQENNIRVLKIVLTIAHLDHDEENHEVRDDRLAALCQKCHLVYDAPEKARRRKEKKRKAALQYELF